MCAFRITLVVSDSGAVQVEGVESVAELKDELSDFLVSEENEVLERDEE